MSGSVKFTIVCLLLVLDWFVAGSQSRDLKIGRYKRQSWSDLSRTLHKLVATQDSRYKRYYTHPYQYGPFDRSDGSMSVDASIAELTRVLEQVELLARNLDYGAMQLLKRLNVTLNNFDNRIGEIADSAKGVTGALENGANQLPHSWIYIAIGLSVLLVALVLVIFLGVKVLSQVRNEVHDMRLKKKNKQDTANLISNDEDLECGYDSQHSHDTAPAPDLHRHQTSNQEHKDYCHYGLGSKVLPHNAAKLRSFRHDDQFVPFGGQTGV